MSQDQQDLLPPGSITYGPDANCTLDTCPTEYSVYGYRPGLAGTIIVMVLFAIPILIQLMLGIRYRTWFYMGAIIIGCITEILGYAGRIMLWQNPFTFDGFLIQIICIACAPVFYAAAIYVTLSQVINYLDPTVSRFSPKLLYWIFVPCDIVSLVLQAAGGGLSSSTSGGSQPAIDVSITGLAFQVFTITVFVALAVDYGLRYIKKSKVTRPNNTRLKIFVSFLSLAIVTLWIRCCYRIFELSGGYQGPNIRDEGLFIGLESSMILVTCYALIASHPGPLLSQSTSKGFGSDSDDPEAKG